ncbi:MAG TPA: nuclear transport factor 2 family protein [Candidatus Eisenbacteria bacterium]|nr:nuclear transport factor 2 family protein [Candidatus Eisenbacteria bacterium]
MPGDRIETVRRIYEGWGRGDFRAGTELYDPFVQFILRTGFPDAGVYVGREEIRRYTQDDFLADLEGVAIAGEEFIAAGDSVVVHVHQSATGAGSGVHVAMRYYQVWTFRGDHVIRIESFRDRADALQAVALRE